VQCSAVLYRLTLPHEHEQLSMTFKDPVLLGFIRIKNSDKNESSDISLVGGPEDGEKIRTNKNNMHQCIYFIRSFFQ
jgi:hypothetical protein